MIFLPGDLFPEGSRPPHHALRQNRSLSTWWMCILLRKRERELLLPLIPNVFLLGPAWILRGEAGGWPLGEGRLGVGRLAGGSWGGEAGGLAAWGGEAGELAAWGGEAGELAAWGGEGRLGG